MTAIVLPDLDRSTIEELRKKIPNLSEIELPELPSMKQVSKTTDQTIDRLLGRSKAPVWPWIAAGVGLVAVIGALAAYFAWFRRPTWEFNRRRLDDRIDCVRSRFVAPDGRDGRPLVCWRRALGSRDVPHLEPVPDRGGVNAGGSHDLDPRRHASGDRLGALDHARGHVRPVQSLPGGEALEGA